MFNSCDPVSFMGIVVWSRMPQGQELGNYDIGVKFPELTDRARSLLIRFIDCVKDLKHC